MTVTIRNVCAQLRAGFNAWFRNSARARRAELYECGEVARIAREVGVSPRELYTIAAKRPDAADQLKLRLESVHLDAAAVRRDDPLIMRDLERACTQCGSKRRCVRDWVRFPDDAGWREYCPNAMTLDALAGKVPGNVVEGGPQMHL